MPAVKYSVEGAVGRITLNRPDALNATNPARARRRDHARRGDRRPAGALDPARRRRARVLRADLKDANTHSANDIVAHMAPSPTGTDRLGLCPKPVVAAVQGWCVGAGVEMAISADVAIAADDATFFLPQVKLGILPGAGGVSRLVRRIGEPWTARMALLGERIKADQALRIGLVTEVVPPRARGRAMEIAIALSEVPPAAVQLCKESINQSYDLPLAAGLMADKYRLFVLSGTPRRRRRTPRSASVARRRPPPERASDARSPSPPRPLRWENTR